MARETEMRVGVRSGKKTKSLVSLTYILILILLASVAAIAPLAVANDQWKTTSIDTDGDGTADLDKREREGEVHLDLNRNGAIDPDEPYCKDVWRVEQATGDGHVVKITYIYDPEVQGRYAPTETIRVKDKNGDGDTIDESECTKTLSEGTSSTKFIDPTQDLVHIYTGEPAAPGEYVTYLDVVAGEAQKVEDKLKFYITINDGIPPLSQSTFWTILMDENNNPEDNCRDYPTANVDTMYSVVFDGSAHKWVIERAKYESWGWEGAETDATWSMISSEPDGKTTIIVSIPLLELDEFQGIMPWKAMTESASYIGDFAPDWQSVTLVLGLGAPQPQIIGQLDSHTVSGTSVLAEVMDMTPSVNRTDITSCQLEYSAYSSGVWNFIGNDTEPRDGWGVDWDISGLSEGRYIVRAIMTNAVGMTGWDDSVIFYDPTPPIPEFFDMEYGQFVKGLTMVEVITSDENALFGEFYSFLDATEKEKSIPPMSQKGADDCGPYAATACLSYWCNYADKNNQKPFKDLCDDTDAARETMAQDMYERVGKRKSSADGLAKAINGYITSKNLQGKLEAKKIEKNKVSWETAKAEFDRCQDVLLLLHYPDCRRHWVTLKGYSEDSDGETTRKYVTLMDPGAPSGDKELDAELKNGKLCHPEGTPPQEVSAEIEEIVTVCPTDMKDLQCDPFLGADYDGSDGWCIDWDTTQEQDGRYGLLARMVDEDGNEKMNITMVHVDNTPPSIASLVPADGKIVGKLKSSVGAEYMDAGSGVLVSAVKLYLDDEDKSSACTITQSSINYDLGAPLSAGGHIARVSLIDNAGNPAEVEWSFTVFLGDVNGSGEVDIFDLVLVAHSFGKCDGELDFNPDADIDCNNAVDIFDLVIVAKNFGKSLPV